MNDKNKDQRRLTDEEIGKIVGSAKKPGLRFTLDLYLLDYMKHCFLDEGQLEINIQSLRAAVDHLEDGEVKNGVTNVIKDLQCVQGEYKEYLEDMQTLADGGYPSPRGAGQLEEGPG